MAELNVHDLSFWFDDVVAAGDEEEAIVDDCYEAATVASDYAGSISECDSDNDHVEHNPMTDSEVGDVGEDEAVEVPQYVRPDDLPLDDLATKAKAG